MRGGRWWVLVLLVVGWSGMAIGAEPDPEAVRRLMEKYEREAAEEAARKAPAPKPRPKPAPAPVPQPKPKPAPTVNYDHEAWKSAEKCGTAACFEAYLEEYPKGRYARMARARLKPAATPRAPATPVVTPAVPSDPALRPDLVRIPAGCFQMGSPGSETGRDEDERQHRVCVEGFEIGQDEVTVGEFKRFVAATNYRTDAEKNAGNEEGCLITYQEENKWEAGYRAGYSWKNPNFKQGDDHPVVCVSWNDALAYVKWLSGETSQSYRLPTEAEWEYAARAGRTTARYWGNDPNKACRYANVADRAMKQTFSDEMLHITIHECSDGYVYTAPVGAFEANAWGLKDLLGNVWEWTCSAHAKDYDGSEVKCT